MISFNILNTITEWIWLIYYSSNVESMFIVEYMLNLKHKQYNILY